jgi:hypothetical protein
MALPDPAQPMDDLESHRAAEPPPIDLCGAGDTLEAAVPEMLPTPRLQRPGGGGPPPKPVPARSEEKAPAPAWTGKGSSVPTLQLVSRATVPDRAGDVPDETPFATDSDAETGLGGPADAMPVLRPLKEAWWVVWFEALLTQRRLQIGIVASVLLLGGVAALWPRGDQGVALSRIRKHPEEFEGRQVRVRGKVGDVFQVGSGHVFQLLQGRDTVVVFSHDLAPVRHQRLQISGSVSTGYLDGVPRIAIFTGSP